MSNKKQEKINIPKEYIDTLKRLKNYIRIFLVLKLGFDLP